MKYYLKEIVIDKINIDISDKEIITDTEEDMKNKINRILSYIYDKYLIKEISYKEIYDQIKPIFVVYVNAEYYKEFDSEELQKEYYETTKNTNNSKDTLFNYLMTFIDYCRLSYDHNFNLLEAKCIDEEWCHAFSYKSLFPDKYHINKYETGDKVRYKNNGEIYTVWKYKTQKKVSSIYESDDPLDYREGYYLLNNEGHIYDGGDYESYLAVDEDLEPVENEYINLTENTLEDIIYYITTGDDIYYNDIKPTEIKYNKFKREDDDFIISYFKNSKEIKTESSFAVTLYDNDKMLAFIAETSIFDEIDSNNMIKVYYKNKLLKEIKINEAPNKSCINICILSSQI